MLPLKHRLFFVLSPASKDRAQIGLHRDAIDDATSHVANHRLHLTLGITDDFDAFPETIAAQMIAIGDTIAADPFALALARVSGGTHSVALRPARCCAPLADLQHQLGSRLFAQRLTRGGWRFNPHVNLAYRAGSPFGRSIAPIRLAIDAFVLIHSLVGATRHVELARWPLVPRQGTLSF